MVNISTGTLGFCLSGKALKPVVSTGTLGFCLSGKALKPIMSSTALEFLIKFYDESVPIFKVVLDFIDIYGGIY